MANSAYMRRDQAMRVIEEFTGRLSECTFALKGAMFTMPAEDGEELRRALDTILLFADDKILLGENVRRAIRDAVWDELDSIADSISDAIEEAVSK